MVVVSVWYVEHGIQYWNVKRKDQHAETVVGSKLIVEFIHKQVLIVDKSTMHLSLFVYWGKDGQSNYPRLFGLRLSPISMQLGEIQQEMPYHVLYGALKCPESQRFSDVYFPHLNRNSQATPRVAAVWS